MTDRRDDDFRVRPSAPKNRGKGQGQSFVSKVLKQAGKASSGKSTVRRPASASGTGQRPGSRLGRGHTAARFAGAKLTPMSRRATIKTLLVNHQRASPQSLAKHLRYIERDGVGRDGEPGQAYGPQTDVADLDAFKERCADDRHHFRFILSPEDGAELEDLRTYTRHLMGRMEADLGTGLDWVAVNHWNTDNPHTHIVVRGRDDTGKDLIIAGDYIADGFRYRAAELATEWLGPRTELEIQQTLQREVEQERWTSLDRTLKREIGEAGGDGLVRVERFNAPRLQRQRLMLIGRLQHLQRLGLADETQPGTWAIHADAEKTLRALGERGDIIRTVQRAMRGEPRELAVFEPGDDGRTILGRVAAKGLADELRDRGYLVIDGVDGKAHYVALNARDELANYPSGAVVEVKGSADVRAADKNIAALASDGLYRTDHHLAIGQGRAKAGRDPQEVVAAHIRRLEALRRAGIDVEVVPGITSAVAGPAAAGIPVTMRGHSSGVTVITGHQDPTAARSIDWEAAARLGTTLVVLMGASRAALIAEHLLLGGLDATTPVAVVESATTPAQRVVRTVLADLPDTPVHAPAILVIGSVAALDVTDVDLGDLVTSTASEHGGSSWLN